jgi:steroid delta-isomerase-like uncharacterized protein
MRVQRIVWCFLGQGKDGDETERCGTARTADKSWNMSSLTFPFGDVRLRSASRISARPEDNMDRRIFMAAAASAAGTLSMPAAAQDSGAKSLPERFAAALSSHDMTAFAALFADDYVNHQKSAAAPPPAPNTSAKQGTVGFFAARLAGMPDLKVEVEAMVASDDMVAASFVYSGTHGGPYFGIGPTGRPLRFTSCDIFRVKNGQCIEHWGMGDLAGLFSQLGINRP